MLRWTSTARTDVRAAVLALIGAAFVFGCGDATVEVPVRSPHGDAHAAAVDLAPVPPDFQLDLLSRLDGTTHARLLVDSAGRPYALYEDVFVPLNVDAHRAPFKVKSASGVQGYAWLDDGVLLLTVGSALGLATPDGFFPILKLPSDGMRIERAAKDRCWIFGGAGDLAGDLFLYVKGGALGHAMRAPKPIRAVAGTPDRFFVATEGSIILVESGAAPRLLFDSPMQILSLDLADGIGVLFSTKAGLFLRTEDGRVTHVTREMPSDFRVSGDVVYLVFDGIGLVRGWPLAKLKAP